MLTWRLHSAEALPMSALHQYFSESAPPHSLVFLFLEVLKIFITTKQKKYPERQWLCLFCFVLLVLELKGNLKTQKQNALILDREILGWEDFGLLNTLQAVMRRFGNVSFLDDFAHIYVSVL